MEHPRRRQCPAPSPRDRLRLGPNLHRRRAPAFARPSHGPRSSCMQRQRLRVSSRTLSSRNHLFRRILSRNRCDRTISLKVAISISARGFLASNKRIKRRRDAKRGGQPKAWHRARILFASRNYMQVIGCSSDELRKLARIIDLRVRGVDPMPA
jgi:hypothetical protein